LKIIEKEILEFGSREEVFLIGSLLLEMLSSL